MKPDISVIAPFTLTLALAIGAFSPETAAEEHAMPAPVVFFDIAAPQLEKQAAFYKAVFGWDVAADGGFAVPVSAPLRGNLRVEPANQGPVTERLIYIGVADVNSALASVTAHGGSVVFPRLEVPGVAVVGLFTDPAGNRMGLVEMEGGKAKVPKSR